MNQPKRYKVISNAIVGQNFEIEDLITELQFYASQKNDWDRAIVVFDKAPFDDFSLEIIYEKDDLPCTFPSKDQPSLLIE